MKVEELENLESEETENLEIDEERTVEDLSQAVKILKDKVSWTKNVGIKNKQEEKERFLDKRGRNESYRPEFEFKEPPADLELLLEALEQLRDATGLISEDELDSYGAKTVEPEDLQRFFDEIFRQFELFAEMAASIENEKRWKELCGEIWPMPDEKRIEESRRKAAEIEAEDLEKELDAEDVRDMFEAEFERLGVNYDVEIREVSGCFNIPEEQKLIVARGEGEERKFSRKEAEMLTMHETFHSIRAYNGAKAGEESGFPDILGVHTPFYDQTEEGGAIYREHRTGTSYSVKEKKYHLMRIAAYEVSQTDDYVEEFTDIVETLVECGASPEQAFGLAARNREVLRHHIYRTGYDQWQEMEDADRLLIGKLSQEWTETFWKEVEAGGMLQKPEVTAEQLFDFSFKD